MAKEKQSKDGERLEQIESTLGKTEMFVEKNKKPLVICVVAVILVVLAIVGWNSLIKEPQEQEALETYYNAEQLSMEEQYKLALEGDGNFSGLVEVVDEFGGTDAGNLAKYYAGVSCLNTGDYENAVKYLKDFESEDMFVKPLAMGLLGDAYLELDNVAEAAKCYEKAAKETDNMLTSPWLLLKAGYTYEMLENYEKALEMYQIMRDKYWDRAQNMHVLKNIATVEAKIASK